MTLKRGEVCESSSNLLVASMECFLGLITMMWNFIEWQNLTAVRLYSESGCPKLLSSFRKKRWDLELWLKEEETCSAGLAGNCLGWGVPVCPGACFEEAWGEAAPHTGTWGYCFWPGWVVFFHACLQHRMQIACRAKVLLDMRLLAWVSCYAKWVHRNVLSSFIKQLEI